ncbi:hypothetical protein TeGR_g11890 [Tetraparma gracilis]|uniref:Protein kinase domain-containing protein n=1 Tax=Tetraparma gracilis TaxID=2962635 RepID=A0ABQ6M9V1_9STRA|nr:hypothetical protein TeGR_g11890 [Tetraparma gracilis]
MEVFATGFITGTNHSTTIEGEILHNSSSPAHASLTASVVIPYAGDWTLHVTQGTYSVQNFAGSPHVITVAPAATTASLCKVAFAPLITAGSTFRATLSTFDAHENPTSHSDDSFIFKLDGDEGTSLREAGSSTLTYSKTMVIAGSYKLHVFLESTGEEVAGSPFHFEVKPSVPAAANSTHNVPTTKSVDSTRENTMKLTVNPRDRFGNSILDATGYNVSVSGGAPEELLPPDYSYTHSIPFGSFDDLALNFTLDGAEIAGSPIIVSVNPSSAIYLGATVTTLLLVLFTNYRKIIHGDDPELAAALDAAGGVLTKESIKIRHQLIVLDLAVATLGINGFVAEDVPSMVLNGAVILIEMLEGTPADESLLASFFALLFSCAMTGRKAGLRQQRRELRQQKMDIEQLERQDQDIQQVRKSQSKLKARKEELEEEVRLKKHSEEELKVMVAALESVSKERQDELKEVMIDSSELKIDKLLGKGGFGVVNLATYKGGKVAMKQLLTVNEENVLRFRHECFLVKNLSHPNVVKLVGVCWSEELFACCLEFVENGSLEDWLRKTVGGKVYHRPKTPVIGKRKVKEEEGPSLAAVTFMGFDHNNEYNPAEHNDVDRAKKEEAEKLLHHWWMQRMNPKMDWTEMFKEDGSRLDHGLSGYHAYDKESRCGRAIASCIINATPAQVMGLYADDRRTRANPDDDVIGTSYTSSVGLLNVPIPIPTVSDRESLYRAVNIKDDAARSFSNVSYTIEDERRPPVSGKVRVDGLFLFVAREAPGSEGERSECFRLSRTNFKFGMGLGFVNALIAAKAWETIAAPLAELKQDVERLVKEYKPPEHRVESLELTWKGGLWRMALEAALGVQYLHHHRYWSDGGKRHNGATNEVEEEEAGWKESVIHRDLKPDNMLLTRDWTLKLTDFGEARAQNMGGTMTSVGTPIYIAPEVMRADHYDVKADTWSYGLCLVAMIRAERTLEQFFYQALRKHKKRRTTKGLGMGQMTKYYYSEGWRPILPIAFVKAYPKLHTLIQECWRVRRKERPNFDQIVARLQGDIGDEIKRKEEPKIELYSKEDDLVYRNRMGKEDELSDSDEEEGGGKSTRREDVVSKDKYDKALAVKDKAMQELKEKMSKEMSVVKKRAEAGKKRAEQEKKQVEAEKKEAVQEKKQSSRWRARKTCSSTRRRTGAS